MREQRFNVSGKFCVHAPYRIASQLARINAASHEIEHRLTLARCASLRDPAKPKPEIPMFPTFKTRASRTRPPTRGDKDPGRVAGPLVSRDAAMPAFATNHDTYA
jgi:hypothetical protein